MCHFLYPTPAHYLIAHPTALSPPKLATPQWVQTKFCDILLCENFKNHLDDFCSSDQTSMWLPCDETVAEPETEAKTEESAAIRASYTCRAEKTLKHVFLSKTVRTLRATLVYIETLHNQDVLLRSRFSSETYKNNRKKTRQPQLTND